MSQALLAYAHFLGVAALFAALTAELLLYRPDLARETQRRLVFVDLGYGAAATLVLVTGLLRVFLGGKGAAFYFGNPAFHLLGATFLVAALLSFYPTRRFLVRRRAQRAGDDAALDAHVTLRIRRIMLAELVLLFVALWFAVLMARGIGSNWLG